MQKFKTWLNGLENGSALGIFRVFFGLLMVYQTWYYHKSGLLTAGLTNPKLLFHYDGLEFLNPLPLPVLQFILVLMGISALSIAAGYFFRVACLTFTILHAYIFLIDKSIFNNHIYLFLLLGFLMAFTDADRFFSLRGNRGFGPQIPRWQTFILQLQLAILYIYGAFAKISTDWFVHLEPMKFMLGAIPADAGGWAAFLKNFAPPWLFSYGGFLFDLLIPFLLWNKKTRLWAIIPALFFHFSNSTIFRDIGVFPYFSVCATILFFNDVDFAKWFSKTPPQKTATPPPANFKFGKILISFFIFQFLFPFRGFFLPNPIDYTNVANSFSWRMKSHAREATQISMTLEDPATGKVQEIPINTFINTMQINLLAADARAPVVFAKFIEKEAQQKFGIRNPRIRANIKIRFNGRPEQFFIDPNVDLTKVNYSPFSKIYWTMPISNY